MPEGLCDGGYRRVAASSTGMIAVLREARSGSLSPLRAEIFPSFSYPGLTPWAALCRRFAAGMGSYSRQLLNFVYERESELCFAGFGRVVEG